MIEEEVDIIVDLYHERWNHFSYLIGAVGDDLKFVEETVNKVYEEVFQKVKPTFSFMRLLANIWHEEVYLHFKDALITGIKRNIRLFNQQTLSYSKKLVSEYKHE